MKERQQGGVGKTFDTKQKRRGQGPLKPRLLQPWACTKLRTQHSALSNPESSVHRTRTNMYSAFRPTQACGIRDRGQSPSFSLPRTDNVKLGCSATGDDICLVIPPNHTYFLATCRWSTERRNISRIPNPSTPRKCLHNCCMRLVHQTFVVIVESCNRGRLVSRHQ